MARSSPLFSQACGDRRAGEGGEGTRGRARACGSHDPQPRRAPRRLAPAHSSSRPGGTAMREAGGKWPVAAGCPASLRAGCRGCGLPARAEAGMARQSSARQNTLQSVSLSPRCSTRVVPHARHVVLLRLPPPGPWPASRLCAAARTQQAYVRPAKHTSGSVERSVCW